jgi:Holliday junction resolvase
MTNYSRGANFERAIVKDLEAKGYWCMRSAGSHGPVDVIAIATSLLGRPQRRLMVQAKIDGKISKHDRSTLFELASRHHCEPIVADRPKRGMIAYRLLISPVRMIEFSSS